MNTGEISREQLSKICLKPAPILTFMRRDRLHMDNSPCSQDFNKFINNTS